MKKYEMVYEANNLKGHQVFACEAENEEEAKKKFKDGEGLPPVGCNCLFKKKTEEDKYFSPCYIIGYREAANRKGDMWLVFSDKYDSLYQHNVTNGSFDFKKPETPDQKKERELLEAAYDLYLCWVGDDFEPKGFEEFVEDADLYDNFKRLVVKTKYRKPE